MDINRSIFILTMYRYIESPILHEPMDKAINNKVRLTEKSLFFDFRYRTTTIAATSVETKVSNVALKISSTSFDKGRRFPSPLKATRTIKEMITGKGLIRSENDKDIITSANIIVVFQWYFYKVCLYPTQTIQA